MKADVDPAVATRAMLRAVGAATAPIGVFAESTLAPSRPPASASTA